MVRKLLNILNMCDKGLGPDDVTFVWFLLACSHAGPVGEDRAVLTPLA
jgi:hypothetical protein